MNKKTDKFRIDKIRYCYPKQADKFVDFELIFPSVKINEMNEQEVDEFICTLIKAHPYFEASMWMRFNIYKNNTFYYSLDFKNDDYREQRNFSRDLSLNCKYPKYYNDYITNQIKETQVKLDKSIKFTHRIDNEITNETSLYFTADKSLLNGVGSYPDVKLSIICVELPYNIYESAAALVSISPVKVDKNGFVEYDWTNIDLPFDEIDTLLNMALEQEKDKDDR